MTNKADRSLSRRRFLAQVVGGAGLLALGDIGRLFAEEVARTRGAGIIPRDAEGRVLRVTRPLDAETPPEAFGEWLTPNNQFFVRSHFGPPARGSVDPKTWRLHVGGLVERSLDLSLSELKRLPEVSVTAVLQCSGNGRAFYEPRVPGIQWQKGAVGQAQWTGVRLADVLKAAGVQTAGREVHLLGADRPVASGVPLFHRSIPIHKALHPDTVLAYGMNGEPLPLLHGAPIRVVTPGWMADTCIKWLTTITVAEQEPEGYFMQTAYRRPIHPVKPGEPVNLKDTEPVTDMVVKSLITDPADGTALATGRVDVRGVAWTGEGVVTRVELSTDQGATWSLAEFVTEAAPYAWRQWRWAWRVERPGSYTLWARATDSNGVTQPLVSTWNPSGFLWNGFDRVSVTVG